MRCLVGGLQRYLNCPLFFPLDMGGNPGVLCFPKKDGNMAGIPQTVFERFQEPGGSRVTYTDMTPGRQRVMTGGNVAQWRWVWTVHISESKPGQTHFHRAQTPPSNARML